MSRCEIRLAPQAVEDLKRLSARDRATVRDAIETHLRFQPTRTSRSRIKRLEGVAHPQFRLRVGDVRVFYDVVGHEVRVLAVISKADAAAWLAQLGESS